MQNENKKIRVYYFGNSDWADLPSREHHLAYNISLMGIDVVFIEEIPSIAKQLKIIFGRRKLFDPSYRRELIDLKVITPHYIPTYFRSSLTPNIDRTMVKRWFKNTFSIADVNKSIAVVSSPVWFFLLEEIFDKFNFVVYDVYDDLQVSSRNNRAYRYQLRCENIAISKSDMITCSAVKICNEISKKYQKNAILLRNGVNEYSSKVGSKIITKNKTIGLVAALNVRPHVYDLELISRIANEFTDCEIKIIGSYTKKQYKLLSKCKNIDLLGVITGDALKSAIMSFSVCIIPFLSNDVVQSINPLKMYEYLSFGKPVVVTNNFDYADAKNLLYLANSSEEFLLKIQNALTEIDKTAIDLRRSYCKENTWKKRADHLLELILQHSK